jgi:hypothetical protein
LTIDRFCLNLIIRGSLRTQRTQNFCSGQNYQPIGGNLSASQDSPEVVEILKQCKKKAIAKLLGHPGKMKEMQWLNNLLKLIGCKLIGKNFKRSGVLYREYFYIAESSRPANWDELAAFTAQKHAQKISEIKKPEPHAAQELEAVKPTSFGDTSLGGNTSPTPEFSKEVEPQPEPLGRMGWVSRCGQWIRASFLTATDGAQYKMLIEHLGEWSEVLVWPHQIRWEDPTLENLT